MSGNDTSLTFEWRGREDFSITWQHQLDLHAARCRGEIGNHVVFVEHNPVITLGRRGESSNLVCNEESLKTRGVDLYRIERGGDITYHGPGQLVGYPIISLKQTGIGARQYVSLLETMLINTLNRFDIHSHVIPGLTGVWVGDIKLAAIGVAIRQGVTWHGFALNISTDLSYYDLIVPCGIRDRSVGSISELLGQDIDLMDVKQICEAELARYLK